MFDDPLPLFAVLLLPLELLLLLRELFVLLAGCAPPEGAAEAGAAAAGCGAVPNPNVLLMLKLTEKKPGP